MTVALAALAAAAIAVADFRWLRVMQREHYIAGSALATARRWAQRRPPNQLLAALAAATALIALARWWPVPAAAAAVLAAAAAAAFPLGLPLGGASQRLVWTHRLIRLAVCCVLLEAIVAAALLALRWPAALGALAVAVPAVIDAGAFVAAPLEARLARRFRTAAQATLGQVAPRVIAVTGSYGKTSTKNHIRDLLSGVFDVVASPASWNNAAGLARTVNEYVTPGTQFLVAEMGTYGPGEIAAMCSWVRPEIGIITAIGPMHLERMKTLDNVTRAKAEILAGTRVAILNVDDDRLAELAGSVRGPEVIRCGTRRQADLDLSLERAADGVTVRYRGQVLGSFAPPPGVHLGNVGCALAAALAAGAPPAAVIGRVGELAVPAHRAAQGVSESGLIVIDDTYNSNPAGARHALEALDAAVAGPRRRAVITPGMVELGPGQDEENRSFAAAVAKVGAVLVVVGWTNRRALVAGAGGGVVVTVASRAAARDWVRSALTAGDGVLWENDLPNHYP
jgi:UDP-N-acetylmuramoyl-tripeptide--D-alanyl-D-alanine ligase